jgi:hypothetical protein
VRWDDDHCEPRIFASEAVSLFTPIASASRVCLYVTLNTSSSPRKSLLRHPEHQPYVTLNLFQGLVFLSRFMVPQLKTGTMRPLRKARGNAKRKFSQHQKVRYPEHRLCVTLNLFQGLVFLSRFMVPQLKTGTMRPLRKARGNAKRKFSQHQKVRYPEHRLCVTLNLFQGLVFKTLRC